VVGWAALGGGLGWAGLRYWSGYWRWIRLGWAGVLVLDEVGEVGEGCWRGMCCEFV